MKFFSTPQLHSATYSYIVRAISMSLRTFIFTLVAIIAPVLFATHSLAVSSTTPIVTLGDGVDASSTTLGPGFSATNTDSFTLRTSTSTATVNNILVSLNAGGKNDGVTWATSTGMINNNWNSVTYGNGLFVAVSSTSTNQNVMTSPDGITWTLRTGTTTNPWISVTYGNGLFVAVAATTTSLSGKTVMTSPDGITWTAQTPGTNNSWNAVTYGNGMFVAVSSTSTNQSVMTSYDGITWTLRTATTTNFWLGVTYGNGLFVAVSSTGIGNNVMTSPDGITWTPRSSAADNTWRGVVYGNGLFVAVATTGTGNRIMTSPDGITWTSRTSGVDNQWRTITYGNGLFVALSCGAICAGASTTVMTSPDGINWTNRVGAAENQWYSVTYGNGAFVGVSQTGTNNRAMVSTSGIDSRTQLGQNNGVTWATSTSAASNSWNSVAYGNGIFAAVAQSGSGNRIMTSYDGITWTRRTNSVNISWNSITYGNGLFVAVGNNPASTGNVMTSSDGITWTTLHGGTTNQWNAVTYGSSTYVAVAQSGIGNRIMTSPNGATWTLRTSPADNTWNSVAYGNGTFVAVASTGAGNRVMRSTNLTTWATSSTVGMNNVWNSVTFGKGLFVAVSATTTSNQSVMTSPDGITWTLRTGTTTNSWQSVTFANGIFVAVGATASSTCVMTSSDGITWTSQSASTYPGWYEVTYGDGRFVAIGGGAAGDNIMTSNSGSYYNYSENYKGISLIEITDNTGATVYGSVTNPSSDIVSVPISSTLTATSGVTQFRIRITPKTNITLATSTNEFPIRARVITASVSSGVIEGEDAVGATTTIDNTSPDEVSSQLSWATQSSDIFTGSDSFSSVVYGNGLFIAVGPSTRFITSPDGVTWTEHTYPTALSDVLYSITYGNGRFVAVGIGNAITSIDGITWSTSTVPSTTAYYYSVTYGAGRYVAVGLNTAMVSYNGITWARANSYVNNSWQSVTYGSGLFVAVSSDGTGNRIMTSPDGITWTARTPSEDNDWRSVTYGNGLFVAVASSNITPCITSCVMTSPDGITWTQRVGVRDADSDYRMIVYANGIFVAISNSYAVYHDAMQSTDGITWSTSTVTSTLGRLVLLTYGNKQFVAIASDYCTSRCVIVGTIKPTPIASNNRITVNFTTPSNRDLSNVLILKNTTLTTDTPGEAISYATSSKLGTSDVVCSYAVATSTSYSCIATNNVFNATPYLLTLYTQDLYGNYSSGLVLATSTPGRAIEIGTGSDTISTDLSPGASATTSDTFTLRADYGSDTLQSVEITFASSTATSTAFIEITNDAGTAVYGSTTTLSNDVLILPVTSLVATTATTTYRIRYTSKSHTLMPLPSVGVAYALTTRVTNVTGTNIVNITGSDTASTTLTIDNASPENVDQLGVIWRTRNEPSNNSWTSVAYGSSTFVAVAAACSSNCVMTSPDGITWTEQAALTNNWKKITYASGLFVVVGATTTNQSVMTSPDGVNWTFRTASAANKTWNSIVYGGGLFVAVSGEGSIMTSPDGIVWTSQTSPASNQWYSVAYGNGMFVATSYSALSSNDYMTSPDGVTWTLRTSTGLYHQNNWQSITYGNGLFVAVNSYMIMTSKDGIVWDLNTTSPAGDEEWANISFNNGRFVVTGNYCDCLLTSTDGYSWNIIITSYQDSWKGAAFSSSTIVTVASYSGYTGQILTSSGPSISATGSQITITSYTPSITDLANILVLQSTSTPVTDTPTEGVSYATSSLVGTATAICSVSVAASTTHTCTASGLTNGTPYYFKIFTQDTTGNWSTGVALTPTSPGTTTVTLGSGNDPVGTTIAPGASATTSDTFTLQTSNGSSTITSVTVTVATTTATSTSLIEITNNAGTTVYGSSTNPTSDVITIPLTFNTLTATSGITQYRIRVTPKTHANMPPPASGTTYNFTSYISSWIGSGARMAGDDYATTTATTTTIVIDNASPENVDELGVKWRTRLNITNDAWYNVAYGNNIFVAVTATTTNVSVITSVDGITWTQRTATTTNSWVGLTYGNGLFVAVAQSGTGNRVMTSPDGITWTPRTSAADNNWTSITFANGVFVAVAGSGTGNRVMTSPDGITWTSRTSAADNIWNSVTYGNGLFIAVASSGTGNRVMTSPDGITWTSRNAVADDYWYSVTYGNGIFVAVGFYGSVMTSPDGLSWTRRSSASSNSWNFVTYSNGLFIAVSQDGAGDRIMTSTDGSTWTSRVNPTDNDWRSVTYGTSTLVAVSIDGNGNRVMTSRGPIITSTSTSVSISFITPDDSDIATTTILRSTASITDVPVEGTFYATSSTVGASTVACSLPVTSSTTYSCSIVSLINGTPYYFKIFTQDLTGNWSTGLALSPVAPGSKIVTLGVGTSTSNVTIAPGGTATTSDTFTLQTDSGTDIITSLSVTFATSTSQALSLVEVTDDAGSTVYGSTANPSSDSVGITLSNNTLTANTTPTQYRVRVTPRSGANMPEVPGSTYYVTSYVSSIFGTAATIAGSDLGAASTTIITIDNESPANPTSASAIKDSHDQIILTYTNPSTTDTQDIVILRSTSLISDTPIDSTNYAVGNTIGSSIVTCVASGTPLSTLNTCIFSTPTRTINYYFKAFTKDTSGNYSTGVVFTGQPVKINNPASGRVISAEVETSNGATTTVTGGGGYRGGGFGDTGTTTTATTTVSTSTPSKGGGGGDSGFIYKGSTIASVLRRTAESLINQSFSRTSITAYAEAGSSSKQTIQKSNCEFTVLGICLQSSSTVSR